MMLLRIAPPSVGRNSSQPSGVGTDTRVPERPVELIVEPPGPWAIDRLTDVPRVSSWTPVQLRVFEQIVGFPFPNGIGELFETQ